MTLHRTPSWLCVLVLVIQPATARADSPASPSDAGGAALLSPDELFDSLRLRKLALDIGPSALAALKTNTDNHAYVRCSWREGSQSLTNVGIHCKGDTAKHLVGGRPDFTITFDRFARGQTFHGHKRLLLQSSAEDASYLGAVLAFEMFRQAGVPAPRCGFAQVELNGRDLGLYVMIEGENRDFLRCHFGNDDGNLYDEGDTHDVTGKLDKDQI